MPFRPDSSFDASPTVLSTAEINFLVNVCQLRIISVRSSGWTSPGSLGRDRQIGTAPRRRRRSRGCGGTPLRTIPALSFISATVRMPLGLRKGFHFHLRTLSVVTGRISPDTSAFSSLLSSRRSKIFGESQIGDAYLRLRIRIFYLSQITQIEGLSFGHARFDLPGVMSGVVEQDIVVLFPVQDPQQHPPDVSRVQAPEGPIDCSSDTLGVKVRNGESVTAVAC